MKTILKVLFWLAIFWILMMFWMFMVQSAKASWAPLKIGGSQRQQDIINYAWHISQDPNWIATLEAENGTWEENRIGVTGDKGICQMNPRSWNWFIKSPQFQDYHYQILMCAAEYSKASKENRLSTTFYGWNRRESAKRNFVWFNN